MQKFADHTISYYKVRTAALNNNIKCSSHQISATICVGMYNCVSLCKPTMKGFMFHYKYNYAAQVHSCSIVGVSCTYY